MAKGARMVVYSASFGGRETTLDLFALYRNRHQILGLDTAARSAVQGAPILRELTPLFESGSLAPPPVAETYPLRDALHAYSRVLQARGKIVLLP